MSNDAAIRVEKLSKLYQIGVRQQGYKTSGKQLLFAAAEREKRGSKGK